MERSESPLSLDCRPVDASRWPDLERLFESRGGPHYCWCMVWRDMPSKQRSDKTLKKAALKNHVQRGVPIGLLGYLGDEPVAWCSLAPRPSYRNLIDGQDTKQDDGIWSIACLFVPRKFRGQGLAGQLVRAAVSFAFANGAEIVEAYPVDRESPSYRFMGFVDLFEPAGFVTAGSAGARRCVMQRRRTETA